MTFLFRPAPITLLALLGLAALPGASVHAQDALGAGNALDGNIQIGRNTQSPFAPLPNFRSRNLLVTRNVAGGRGFRGTVGYSAAGDFLGELGSDDLFGFRSDSALSSLAAVSTGISQNRFHYGQDTGVMAYHRSTLGIPQGRIVTELVPSIERQIFIDRQSSFGSRIQLADLGAEPRRLNIVPGSDGRAVSISTSSLKGIQAIPVDQDPATYGLSTTDALRVREDYNAGMLPPEVGLPFQSDFSRFGPASARDSETTDTPANDSRLETGTPDALKELTDPQARVNQRIDPAAQTDYEAILERMIENYAGRRDVNLSFDTQLTADLQERYDELRATLGDPTAQPEDDAFAAAEPTPSVPMPSMTQPIDPLTGRPIGAPNPIRLDDEDMPNLPVEPTDLEEFSLILDHDGEISTLAADSRDRFNERLALGEESLREGEYFLAESRFERALRFVPAHPLGLAGLAHAQIGAGLHLSASLSLRDLFRRHPEMIDARYRAALLPTSFRLDEVKRALRERIDEERDGPAYALVLAYLGHQTEDEEALQDGLAVLTEKRPDDPLTELIGRLWTNSNEPTAEPSTAEPGS